MKKTLTVIAALFALTGCSTLRQIEQYMPNSDTPNAETTPNPYPNEQPRLIVLSPEQQAYMATHPPAGTPNGPPLTEPAPGAPNGPPLP